MIDTASVWRDRAIAAAGQLSAQLVALELEAGPAQDFGAFLANERPRVCVLGAYRHGKTSLVMALAGCADLLPVHILPGPPAFVELAAATDHRVERSPSVADGRFTPSNLDALTLALAAEAGDSPSEPTSLPALWRVRHPGTALQDLGAVLLDTPALGQSLAMDTLILAQARRSDRVVLVIDAAQTVSAAALRWMGLIAQAGVPTTVVVNGIDRIEPGERERIAGFVRQRCADVGLPLPAAEPFLVSARDALAGAASVGEGDDARQAVDGLRTTLRRALGARDASDLTEVARRFLGLRAAIGQELDTARERAFVAVRAIEATEAQRQQAAREYAEACAAVERARAQLARPERLAAALVGAFESEVSAFVNGLDEMLRDRVLDVSPATSPGTYVRRLVEEIAGSFQTRIATWMSARGVAITAEEIARSWADALEAAPQLREALGPAPGRDLPEEILAAAATRAFGQALRGVAPKSGGASVTVAAASLAAGYALADVGLFYILGIVQGFLNPVLLVAAATAGAALYTTQGRAVLDAYLRKQTIDGVRTNLSSPDLHRQARETFGSVAAETCAQLAAAFSDRASARVHLLRHVHDDATAALAHEHAAGGDPGARARAARVIECACDEVRALLDTLGAFVIPGSAERPSGP